MNAHERRRKRDIGIAFLADAVADVLAQSQPDSSDGWFSSQHISRELGFADRQFGSGLCRGILNQMFQQGEVEYRPGDGEGIYDWRLRL